MTKILDNYCPKNDDAMVTIEAGNCSSMPVSGWFLSR